MDTPKNTKARKAVLVTGLLAAMLFLLIQGQIASSEGDWWNSTYKVRYPIKAYNPDNQPHANESALIDIRGTDCELFPNGLTVVHEPSGTELAYNYTNSSMKQLAFIFPHTVYDDNGVSDRSDYNVSIYCQNNTAVPLKDTTVFEPRGLFEGNSTGNHPYGPWTMQAGGDSANLTTVSDPSYTGDSLRIFSSAEVNYAIQEVNVTGYYEFTAWLNASHNGNTGLILVGWDPAFNELFKLGIRSADTTYFQYNNGTGWYSAEGGCTILGGPCVISIRVDTYTDTWSLTLNEVNIMKGHGLITPTDYISSVAVTSGDEFTNHWDQVLGADNHNLTIYVTPTNFSLGAKEESSAGNPSTWDIEPFGNSTNVDSNTTIEDIFLTFQASDAEQTGAGELNYTARVFRNNESLFDYVNLTLTSATLTVIEVNSRNLSKGDAIHAQIEVEDGFNLILMNSTPVIVRNSLPSNVSLVFPANASNLSRMQAKNWTGSYDWDRDKTYAYVEVDDDPAFGSPDFINPEVETRTPEGAVSYWNFEEGRGDTAHDVWSGNDGVISGAEWVAGSGTNGTGNYALSCDGDGDYVDTGTSEFEFSNYTIEFFLNNSNAGQTIADIVTLRNAGNLFLARLESADQVRVFFNKTDGSFVSLDTSSSYNVGELHHFAVKKEGTNISVYFDGIVEGTLDSAGEWSNPSKAVFCSNYLGTGSFVNATIDDIIFTSVAKSDAQILEDAQFGNAGRTPVSPSGLVNATDPDLVLALNFERNQTENGYVKDLSQYNNSATVSGNGIWNQSGRWDFDGELGGSLNLSSPITISAQNGSVCFTAIYREPPDGIYIGRQHFVSNNNQFQSFIGVSSFGLQAEGIANEDYWIGTGGGTVALEKYMENDVCLVARAQNVSAYVNGDFVNSSMVTTNLTFAYMGGPTEAMRSNVSVWNLRAWDETALSEEQVACIHAHGQPDCPADGTWYWRVANLTDEEGTNTVPSETFQLTLDTAPNDIYVDSPGNQTYTDQTEIDLNVSSTGDVASWVYSTDGGDTNNSFSPNTTITLGYGSTDITVCNSDLVGNVNCTTVTASVIASPSASGTGFTVIDLLNGNESLEVNFTVADAEGLGNIDSCWVYTGWGNFTGSLTDELCNATVNVPQNQSVSLTPYVQDTHGLIGSGNSVNGVQAYLYRYIQDLSYESNFTEQHFIEQYNLTTSSEAENVNFSANTTDEGKLVNLSVGQNLVEKNNFTSDFVDEATQYEFPGDEFTAGEAYQATRYVVLNNTLTGTTLGELQLSVNVSELPYSSAMDVEKQDILYEDINFTFDGESGLVFNLSELAAGGQDNYRYTYEGFFVSLLQDIAASYRLSGDLKEWTYTPQYQVNLDLTGKEMNHSIATVSRLPEWNAKLNWGSVLQNSTGTSISHTATDESDILFITFNPSKDTYSLTVSYYTETSGSGETGGGAPAGGGGGAPIVIIQPSENLTEEEKALLPQTQVITFDTQTVNWLVPYVPSGNEKTIQVEMTKGNLRSSYQISENLAGLVTVATCDIDNLRCVKDRIDLDQGQKANIYLQGIWNDDVGQALAEAEQGQIEGYVTFQGVNKAHKIRVVLEAAPLYPHVRQLSKTLNEKNIPVDEPVTAGGVYSLIGLSLIGLLWLIAKAATGR